MLAEESGLYIHVLQMEVKEPLYYQAVGTLLASTSWKNMIIAVDQLNLMLLNLLAE